jgi:membrane-associated phospholipid phosphatase
VYRLEGASAAIRGAAGPLVTDVFALVTELGGVAFLLVFLSVLYWVDDRETTAAVIGFALVAVAVTTSLKVGLGLPRPPPSVRAVAVDAGSYGFPSGHATAATAVYGGLALTRGRLHDRRVLVGTATLVGLVGLSRVVIGVHYLGDVLAGFLVGSVVLATLWRGVGRRADRACLVAVACVLPGVFVGGGRDTLLVLGASLGGALAFRAVDTARLRVPASLAQRATLVAVGLLSVGALYWLASSTPFGPAAVVGNAAVVAAVVVLPAWFPDDLPSPRSAD